MHSVCPALGSADTSFSPILVEVNSMILFAAILISAFLLFLFLKSRRQGR